MSTEPCLHWCLHCRNSFPNEAKYFEHLLGWIDETSNKSQPQATSSKRKQTFDVLNDDEEEMPFLLPVDNTRRRLLRSTPSRRSKRARFADEHEETMSTREVVIDQLEPTVLFGDRDLKTCEGCGKRMKNISLHQRKNKNCPAYSPMPTIG